LPAPTDADRLSEPTAPGALQLPPDGLPILLMADRNPTGGYPRLGHVARVDRSLAAQLSPGDRVRFSPLAATESLHLCRDQESALQAALATLRA
jgi:antagonist of KipI